jgi:hypothetical protein
MAQSVELASVPFSGNVEGLDTPRSTSATLAAFPLLAPCDASMRST